MVPVSSCSWQSEVRDRREDTVNFSSNPVEISAATDGGPPQPCRVLHRYVGTRANVLFVMRAEQLLRPSSMESRDGT
jgi:hypothetical protein